MSKSEFRPLDTQRAIRQDTDLTSTQRHLLHVATLRADNGGRDAGRVRASLEVLSEDAAMAPRTAERAFRQSRVLSYFRKVERRTRRVGLWFHLTPDNESGVTNTTPGAESGVETTTPDSVSATPDRESGRLPVHLPKSSQRAHVDNLTEQLHKASGWGPEHCRQQLDAKRTELRGRMRQPAAIERVLQRIVADTWADELQPPARQRPRTVHVCGDLEPHGPHDWDDRRRDGRVQNRNHCPGELPPPPSGDLFGNFAGVGQ